MIRETQNNVAKLKKYTESDSIIILFLEGFTLPKMLWVQQHEPDIWGTSACIYAT